MSDRLRLHSMQNLVKYVEEFDFPFVHDVSKYEKIAKIGQGTFGEVFKARCRQTQRIVALKKVLMENEREGFPITALREIKLLQNMNHINIVELIEIARSKPTSFNRGKAIFYLVFAFCEHDLAGLISNRQVNFNLAEMKQIMKQLLEGLYYIHNNRILHRDMKTANILMCKDGTLKLADFGLARPLSTAAGNKPVRYTNRVVTLWYRAPELLLGQRDYAAPIDVWGAGCIMAELWTRCPIMQGDTEQRQITLISQLCGPINETTWPTVSQLENYARLELAQDTKRRVKERLKPYVRDGLALDMLDKMLTLSPSLRIDAEKALDHDFFWSDPMPTSLERVMSTLDKSHFEMLASARHRARPGPNPGHGPSASQQRPIDGQQHFERIF